MLRTTATLVLLLFINLVSYSSQAATEAGTRIINQAEASYFDTGSGQDFQDFIQLCNLSCCSSA